MFLTGELPRQLLRWWQMQVGGVAGVTVTPTAAGDVFAVGQLLHWLRAQVTDGPSDDAEQADAASLHAALCAHEAAARPTAAEALRHGGWQRVCAVAPRATAVCCIGAFCGGAPRDALHGVSCRPRSCAPHFVCDRCLESHVAAETALELRVRRERGGGVCCPHKALGCDAPPLADGALARRLPEAAFDRYLTARVEVREAAAAEEVRAGATVRGGANASGSSSHADEVEAARRHVEERVLNTSCPRCGTVRVCVCVCLSALRFGGNIDVKATTSAACT
jgi:hypothetical protein